MDFENIIYLADNFIPYNKNVIRFSEFQKFMQDFRALLFFYHQRQQNQSKYRVYLRINKFCINKF